MESSQRFFLFPECYSCVSAYRMKFFSQEGVSEMSRKHKSVGKFRSGKPEI